MEAFSYTDIFDTKGIEYLVIIAFLLLIIPFWRLLNRPLKPKYLLNESNEFFSEKTINVPQGLFFGKNHTWAHLEKSGKARIGLDDLILHITGSVEIESMKKPGDEVKRGDVMAVIRQGAKEMRVKFPLSGTVISYNKFLSENPAALNTDPYGQGWIVKLEPLNWRADTNDHFLAGDAVEWSKKEIVRFKDFIARSQIQPSGNTPEVILQEGGEMRNYPLAEMDDSTWRIFEKDFMKM